MGFGDAFGGSAGFQVGAPGAANNDLLMTVMVGLGAISLMNIIVSIAMPLFATWTGAGDTAADKDGKPADTAATARRYQRNIAFLADNVLNAIEAFGNQHQ